MIALWHTVRLYEPRADIQYSIAHIQNETPEWVWRKAMGPQRVDDEVVGESGDNEDELAHDDEIAGLHGREVKI